MLSSEVYGYEIEHSMRCIEAEMEKVELALTVTRTNAALVELSMTQRTEFTHVVVDRSGSQDRLQLTTTGFDEADNEVVQPGGTTLHREDVSDLKHVGWLFDRFSPGESVVLSLEAAIERRPLAVRNAISDYVSRCI